MAQMIDPVVARWLDEIGLGALTDRGLSTLAALTTAFLQPDRPPVPSEVLEVWHRSLAEARIEREQSELRFIEQARRAGWSLDRIAAALGLAGADEVIDAFHTLGERRFHPSVDDRPWRTGEP